MGEVAQKPTIRGTANVRATRYRTNEVSKTFSLADKKKMA